MQAPSVKTVILRITLIIGMVELLIMLLLSSMELNLNSSEEALFDSVLLVVLSTPLIYLWVIRPYVLARDEAVAKVTYMAFHDPLTQLANRHLIAEHLEKILASIGRHKLYGALLMIDLDDFKPINDNSGHGTGDSILLEVAIRLQANIRSEDIAGRLGGDEFVVILCQLDSDAQTALNGALHIAGRIQAAITQPITLKETYRLSASIGLRVLGDDTADIDVLMKEADIAMYRAKQNGKGNTVVFE